MQTLLRILRQKSNRRGVVAVQLLQSLSIMVQNLTSDIAICKRPRFKLEHFDLTNTGKSALYPLMPQSLPHP